MTGGTRYKKLNCKKLNGNVFEGIIINARTDRYNITCSIDSHKKYIPSSFDDGSSGRGCPLPSNSTT